MSKDHLANIVALESMGSLCRFQRYRCFQLANVDENSGLRPESEGIKGDEVFGDLSLQHSYSHCGLLFVTFCRMHLHCRGCLALSANPPVGHDSRVEGSLAEPRYETQRIFRQGYCLCAPQMIKKLKRVDQG